MGYYLKFVQGSGNPDPALLGTVRRLVDEVDYLSRAWEGNLEFQTIKDCCWRAAESMSYIADGGDPKSWQGRAGFRVGTARGVLIQEKSKTSTLFAFIPASCFKDVNAAPPVLDDKNLNKGIAVEVLQTHDPLAKSMLCACCGKKVSMKETSLAHNVVSQQAWKAIVDASMGRFLAVIEKDSLATKVSSYSKLSAPSGTPLKMPLYEVYTNSDRAIIKEKAKEAKRKEFDGNIPKDAEKLIDKAGADALKNLHPLSDPRNQELFDRLIAAGMIETSSFAASDQAGRQCRDCEEAQGNATLIQRDQLTKDGYLPDIAKAKDFKDPLIFVGPQLNSLPTSIDVGDGRYQVLNKTDKDEAVKRATLRQISRFLLGIEKTIGDYAVELSKNLSQRIEKGQNTTNMDFFLPPLLGLMLDHWNEFLWTFRTVALEVASVPYTGEFGKLKFKSGKQEAMTININQ